MCTALPWGRKRPRRTRSAGFVFPTEQALQSHAVRAMPDTGLTARIRENIVLYGALAALAQMSLLTTTTSSNSRIDSLDSVAL